MRQVILESVERLVLREIPTPQPGPGEVLVQVEACGVCGSDLHMFRGHHPILKPPIVMGHEFAGHVAGVGEGVSGVTRGQRVIVFPGIACGECRNCRAGRVNQCEGWKVVGGHVPGGLAEYAKVPATCLIPLADDLDWAAGALVEVVAVGVHAVERGRVAAGEVVAVFGAGPIGLVVAQVAQAQGAEVLIAEPAPTRRQFAQSLGLTALEPAVLSDVVARRFGRDGVHAAFDCVGRQEVIDQGLSLVGRGGRMILVGILSGNFAFSGQLVQRGERDLIGVQAYVPANFARAAELIRSGQVAVRPMITHQFSLEEAAHAFGVAGGGDPTAVKVLIRPTGAGKARG